MGFCFFHLTDALVDKAENRPSAMSDSDLYVRVNLNVWCKLESHSFLSFLELGDGDWRLKMKMKMKSI